MILFENLFKPRQRRLAVDMVTDFVGSIHNLKTVFWADFVSLIYNLKAVLWAAAASFLVCSLIFIEYKHKKTQTDRSEFFMILSFLDIVELFLG